MLQIVRCLTLLEVRPKVQQTFEHLPQHEGGLVVEPVDVNLGKHEHTQQAKKKVQPPGM